MKSMCTSFCNHLYYTLDKQLNSPTYSELCFPYSCSASDFSTEARLEATSLMLSTIPNSFPILLQEVMRLQKVSVCELCNRIPLSEHTVSVLRTKQRTSYSIKQIVALIIGLQLPPFLSRRLLVQAGIYIDGNPKAAKYMYVVDTMFMLHYYDVVNRMESAPFSDHFLL